MSAVVMWIFYRSCLSRLIRRRPRCNVSSSRRADSAPFWYFPLFLPTLDTFMQMTCNLSPLFKAYISSLLQSLLGCVACSLQTISECEKEQNFFFFFFFTAVFSPWLFFPLCCIFAVMPPPPPLPPPTPARPMLDSVSGGEMVMTAVTVLPCKQGSHQKYFVPTVSASEEPRS